jgi:uncharacterized protein (TIGR00299 family) protein
MIAYLDLPSGISGDMFLGCLLDAGWSIDHLRQTISRLKLPAGEWSIDARRVQKGALSALLVEVKVTEPHHHRNLHDIQQMIQGADLPPAVQQRAIAIFKRLAAAEAKVHGTTIDRIHFHEVGATDAIIDIVGAAAGMHALGIETLYASPLPLGRGWASMEHGQLPLPAPATLEILAAVNAPTLPAPAPGEWVTPTGAAIVAELARFNHPPIRLSKIAIGAGQRDCPWPNVARLWLGNPEEAASLVQLETNIDDMNPQLFPAVSERLFAAGARDVWLTPIQMKKGRPGLMLSVLASAAAESAIADLILRHTTTLGVRVHGVAHRHEARREIRLVQTAFGPVHMKLKYLADELVGATPEYEDCRALSEAQSVPVAAIQAAASAAAQALFPSPKRPV